MTNGFGFGSGEFKRPFVYCFVFSGVEIFPNQYYI